MKFRELICSVRTMLTWIRFVQELVDEDTVLVVIPIIQRDGEFLVISVHLGIVMNDEWGSQSVDILTVEMRVVPVRSTLVVDRSVKFVVK